MFLLRKLDKLTAWATGAIDAGACIDKHGCCCGTIGSHKALDCYGNCVQATTCMSRANPPCST